MTHEEWLREPGDDTRPIIAECVVCGQPIHGGDDFYEADEFGMIEDNYLHRDCVMEYFDKFCRCDK